MPSDVLTRYDILCARHRAIRRRHRAQEDLANFLHECSGLPEREAINRSILVVRRLELAKDQLLRFAVLVDEGMPPEQINRWLTVHGYGTPHGAGAIDAEVLQ